MSERATGQDDTTDAPDGLLARTRRRLVDPDLLARIEQLEAQAVEARELSLRISELTDLVTELIVPLARLDPEHTAAILAKYQAELGS